MAGDCSFDIVSQFDEQELVNAIDQTRREVKTRYDLKDTKTEIAYTKDDITILTDSSLTLKNVRDILESKAIRRKLSLKIFKPGKEEKAAGGKVQKLQRFGPLYCITFKKVNLSCLGTDKLLSRQWTRQTVIVGTVIGERQHRNINGR